MKHLLNAQEDYNLVSVPELWKQLLLLDKRYDCDDCEQKVMDSCAPIQYKMLNKFHL